MNQNNNFRNPASRLIDDIRRADIIGESSLFPGFDYDDDFDDYVSLDELEMANWMDDDEEDEEW